MNITDEHPTAHAFEVDDSASESGTGRPSDAESSREGHSRAPSTPSADDSEPRYEATPQSSISDDEDVVYICKRCMTAKSDDPKFCRDCGERLVPIRSVRDSYLGDTVGGKYKLVEQIGSGGMGEVYLGINEPLDQRVAVKFLSRDYTANEQIIMRFLNEARSYARVSHPNAVTLLDYGQHEDGSLYIITEYIEGVSLTDAISDHGALPPKKALSVAIQVCEVLSSAHGEGVIHRDLKPDNIMLMPASRGRYAVKVLDFGIAKIVDDEGTALTETGSVFGTPEFMSPEQAEGKTADARSDIYALGIILFYASTGRLPFDGESQYSVLEKQIKEAPPKASSVRDDIEVGPHVERVIERCLQKERERRYESAAELLEALERARGESADGAIDSDLGIDVEDAESEQRTVDLTDLIDDSGGDDTHGYPAGALEIDSRADTAFASRIGDLDPEGGFEFSGELDAVDLSNERERQKRPSTLTLAPSGIPTTALGVAAAIVAVGGIVVWQVWSSAERAPSSSNVAATGAETKSGTQKEDRARRLLSTAHGWLHEGTVGKARRQVERAASMTATGGRSASFSSLLAATRRRLEDVASSRNAFTAASEAGECELAKKRGRALVASAPGTAPWVARSLNACTGTEPSGSSGDSKAPSGAGEPAAASPGRDRGGDEPDSHSNHRGGAAEGGERASGGGGRPASNGVDRETGAAASGSNTAAGGRGESSSSKSESEQDGEGNEPDVSEEEGEEAERADHGEEPSEDGAVSPDDGARDAASGTAEKDEETSEPTETDEDARSAEPSGPVPAGAAETSVGEEPEAAESGASGASAEPAGRGKSREVKGREQNGSGNDEVPDGMALPPSEM